MSIFSKVKLLIIALAILILAIFFLWKFGFLKDDSSVKNYGYSSQKHGITFLYPETYFVQERELGNGEREHYSIVLLEDTEENRDLVSGKLPGRESPPVIVFDIFQNIEGVELRSWIDGSAFSNSKLMIGDGIGSFSTEFISGFKYVTDGLYQTKNVVFESSFGIVKASVGYLNSNDQIVKDFEDIIASVKVQ